MSELANSDLALRQVEYYMSDGNYPFDTYLQSLVREADGCVPLEKLVEFPRLKKLVDGDVAKLRDALGATDSLAFSDARDGVRRLHPTPDDDPARERSVHVTGFPKGAGEEGVKAALAKYGAVASVRLLRNLNQDTRQLDGSAIVASAAGEDGALRVQLRLSDNRLEGRRRPQVEGVWRLDIVVAIDQHGGKAGVDDALAIHNRVSRCFHDLNTVRACFAEVICHRFRTANHIAFKGRVSTDGRDTE